MRLHYVYPYPHVDDLIPLMAEGKVLPYLDVPFQHASPKILKAMKRPAAEAKTLQRIREWREAVPDLTIRSTFIVGFPGETEQDFQTLLDWLEEAELDRVGCFRYEPVRDAAANALPNAVPEEVKEERWHRFMAAQQTISARRLAAPRRHRYRRHHRRARRRASARPLDGRCAGDRRPRLSAGRQRREEAQGRHDRDARA